MERSFVCDKLFQCENVCVGLIPEGALKLSAYIADHYGEEVFNEADLAIVLAKIMEDENIDVDKNSAQYLPMVIDELFDTDFAENFREICNYVFGYDPARNIKREKYPKYVTEAVEWWATEVLMPSVETMPSAFAKIRCREFSKYEVNLFKQTLAKEIMSEVEREGSCFIHCNMSPDKILGRAGRKIGLNPLVGYPPERQMVVFREQLRFSREGEKEYTIKEL